MKNTEQKIIWIADDDPDDQLMIKEAFEESIYKGKLVFFDNGENVLNCLKENKKQKSNLPSLILLDLNMPRMNGDEVLSYIKEQGNHAVPVVILTTSASDSERYRAEKLGATAFLTKPYEFSGMIKIIEELIKIIE